MQSRVIALVLPILLVLFLYMTFYCVPQCGKSFGNPMGLNRHEKSCRILQEIRQKSVLLRRERGIMPPMTVQARQKQLERQVRFTLPLIAI